MSNLIYGQEDRLLPWAQDRVSVAFRRDAYTLGLEKNGELVAVVVYDSFGETDCAMHIASDGTKAWMNKALLLSAFAYPFKQLGLLRVTGLVPADNNAALEFDKNLGFKEEGYHPKAGPGGKDLVSLGLLKENCRFVGRDK